MQGECSVKAVSSAVGGLQGHLANIGPPAHPTPARRSPRRAIVVAWSEFDTEDFGVDVMNHPLLNIIYYGGVEIVPSALVLYILRKLPPKRTAQGYQPIPAQ